MRDRPIWSAAILAALLILASGRPVAASEDWLPITEEEKALKDCPQQPGAPAIFLYREEINDDNTFISSYYCRIKILTAAGKERANIEIPFLKGLSKIEGLKARVVRPDGTSVEFNGQIFDKTALRTGGFKVTVKTFALPDVDVGSIIEYRYKKAPDYGGGSLSKRGEAALENLMDARGRPEEGGIDTESGVLFFPVETWDIQEDLFTRKAKFAYEPSDDLEYLFGMARKRMMLNWVTRGLEGSKPERKKGRIELEIENVPAFETEEFMVPESTQRMMVRIFYLEGTVVSSDKYWQEESENWEKGAEKFMRKSGDAAAEALRVIQGVSDPVEKLKRIYERVQEIKNLSYDKTLTRQRKRELKIKENRNVADVLKNNYGLRSDITRTFTAMARAAGFEAQVIRVVMRDDKFFEKNLCGLYTQFDSELATVRVNGVDKLFDPATPYCPVGLIRWNCTGTVCLWPSDAPPAFRSTPMFPPDTALIQREIVLGVDAEGNLAGTANVTFSGQEALIRRLDHIGDDRVEVKKALEAEMAEALPAGAKVTLQKLENIDNSADKLLVDFEISLPGLATLAGERTLLPISPLLGRKQHPFRHATRKYGICFPYPYREFNDIVVNLPPDMTVETTPAPRQNHGELFDYSLSCAVEGGTKIHVQRDLIVKKTFFPADQYLLVKYFFDQVRAGDEEQVVLTMVKK
jgi:hypothetical protein